MGTPVPSIIPCGLARVDPHFRQKIEEFEVGASLVRQTYHFNFKGSSLVRANLQGKSQKYFYAENLL